MYRSSLEGRNLPGNGKVVADNEGEEAFLVVGSGDPGNMEASEVVGTNASHKNRSRVKRRRAKTKALGRILGRLDFLIMM